MSSSAHGLKRDALGLGLRLPHYAHVLEHEPAVGYFEIISENFLGPAPAPRARLDRVRRRYPIVLHGVGLNLLGHEPIDDAYVDAVARLADEVDAPFVTDHLCWTRDHARSHHDLLPTPYTRDLVELAAERAFEVQRRIGRPFGLENLSSYVTFEQSTMTEWEFHSAVIRESGTWWLLDVNNVYVSSKNHGFDPDAYLAAVDFSRVLQAHLAGHTVEPSGMLVDTHAAAVTDVVRALYARAWKRGGPFPTMIEWDDRIPPMPEMLAELARVEETRR